MVPIIRTKFSVIYVGARTKTTNKLCMHLGDGFSKPWIRKPTNAIQYVLSQMASPTMVIEAIKNNYSKLIVSDYYDMYDNNRKPLMDYYRNMESQLVQLNDIDLLNCIDDDANHRKQLNTENNIYFGIMHKTNTNLSVFVFQSSPNYREHYMFTMKNVDEIF